jgi:hypothetical protein
MAEGEGGGGEKSFSSPSPSSPPASRSDSKPRGEEIFTRFKMLEENSQILRVRI